MVLFTVVGQIKTAKRSYFYFCLHNVLHQKNSFEHVQHTFFFNNQHCLDKMQRLFLEVVQGPRPFPSLTKCWEPTKSPRTSLHSGLSEIPLQGGTALENRLKDLKIKDCSWDPSKRNQQLLSTERNPEPISLPGEAGRGSAEDGRWFYQRWQNTSGLTTCLDQATAV